jgi:hypothetical protein
MLLRGLWHLLVWLLCCRHSDACRGTAAGVAQSWSHVLFSWVQFCLMSDKSAKPLPCAWQIVAEPNMLPLNQHSTDKQAQGYGLHLPSTTEPLICGSIDYSDRKSLLKTSRWGRDAVLREARSVFLSLEDSDAEGHNLRPLARLLARACEAAQPGQLSLHLSDKAQCPR